MLREFVGSAMLREFVGRTIPSARSLASVAVASSGGPSLTLRCLPHCEPTRFALDLKV